MPLPAGKRLDSYEIVGPLGTGGMGEVYRARDTALKRDVAIKVLPEYWSRDPERLRRFEQEAQAAATLNHPNIVSIHHIGSHDGSPYIVTELLQGETLRDRLRLGPMPSSEALKFGAAIAEGMAAAHAAGVVHRDLKPENIFLTKDDRVKVLDFGLAKFQPRQKESADGETVTMHLQTEPGHVLGTVGYMSPEQVRGDPADARSDIFSLGVILYEMVTGRRAFRKGTSAETMVAILNEEPPSITQVSSTAPPALQRVISRCLMKSPEQRFQNASDVAFALEAASAPTGAGLAALTLPDSIKLRCWIAAAVVLSAIGAFTLWRLPPPVPSVAAINQITDDGEPKTPTSVVTDGFRVYFNEGGWDDGAVLKIRQAAVTGGPTAIVPVHLPTPSLAGLNSEGSTLLVLGPGNRNERGMWSVPVPAGEPQRIGSARPTDAAFCPDGRVMYVIGNELFIADKDGSNPRKLLTAAGALREPSMSPDGSRIVYTVGDGYGLGALYEARADGSGAHLIANKAKGRGYCCAHWMPDGKYIVFQSTPKRADLWMMRMSSGRWQRAGEPIRLTAGPLSYELPVPSRDGKQIFAIGYRQRGELVRYDLKLKQFVPLLPGISAFHPTFSNDGQWVAFTSYPDYSLWRCRTDGSDCRQLTSPPAGVIRPMISPDGTRVAFTTFAGELMVMSMEGGEPLKTIPEVYFALPAWSPDGNSLVYVDRASATHRGFYFLDLRSGAETRLQGAKGMRDLHWAGDSAIVGITDDRNKLALYDVKTQTWSDLVPGPVPGLLGSLSNSTDFKYVYYTTGGEDPFVWRVGVADRKIELIARLKDLRRGTGPFGGSVVSVLPDGSPVFTRNTGSEEIYALTLKWE